MLFNLFPLPQSQGFSGSLKFMGRLADAGVNILIFPEGGHSRDGKMQPFQLGLGIMVKELGIPVVPIKISGTEQVLPHEAQLSKTGQGDGNLRRAAAVSLRGAGRDRGKDAPGGGKTLNTNPYRPSLIKGGA